MRNLLLTIGFVGTNFVGWQVQENGISVMEKMQDAIEAVTGVRSPVKGCSRTDSGVHANAYCLSVKTESPIPIGKLPMALNQHLPEDIAVFTCEEKPLDFHARYDCIGKEYLYKIHCSPVRDPFQKNRVLEYSKELDEKLMQEAARFLVGKHDFKSFCSIRTDQLDTTRTLYWVTVERKENVLFIKIAGDGFLFNMVRIITGTLLWVGKGKLNPSDLPLILEAQDRTLAGMTAAAKGLYLNRVFYFPEEVMELGENPKF